MGVPTNEGEKLRALTLHDGILVLHLTAQFLEDHFLLQSITFQPSFELGQHDAALLVILVPARVEIQDLGLLVMKTS